MLQPVDVSGVTVSRATLHNALELARRDVRPGDTVRIHRAGDVIPEVVERVARAGRRSAPFRMPARCPVCRTRVVTEGPLTWCPNRLGCRAQLVGRLVHFASGDAFDLEGLGPRTIEAMVKQGLVKRAADLFRLTPEALRGLEGIGPRLAGKLVRMIQSRRRVELARFLIALGIPGVGGATARDLARHFGRFDRLRTASPSALRTVPGIGEETARSISAFLRDAANSRAIDALLMGGVTVLAATTPAKGALSGKRVVFTGELDVMTRGEAEELVRAAGGEAADAVSRRTDFVVVGAAPGTKLERARALGVRVLFEADFHTIVKRGRKA
jgi:DNA ligase (NAD+)